MAKEVNMSAQERKWQAEDDARIMAQYQEIMNDKARMSRATKEDRRIRTNYQERKINK